MGAGHLEDGPRPPVALYVHVPFCVSVCPYCDFVVLAGAAARGPRSRVAAFVAALEAELDLRADALDERWGSARPPLRSLYLGGGTPSLLPAHDLDRLVGLVRRRFGLAPDAEVTIEVNPGPDERGDAAGFRDVGVSRVSIGAQSLDAAELRRLGRRHAPADVAATVEAARAAGIPSVSLDLLLDLPGSTLDRFTRTLDAALALEPDHLSIYALTLDDPDAEGLTGDFGDHLPVRSGARRWRDRARAAQDADRAAAEYELADGRLAEVGLAWYEISNWARPGHESRHNQVYWRREPYEAVGPGAHAFDGAVRRWNAARLDGYLAALAPAAGAPALPPGGSEALDAQTAAAEAAILALRTAGGLDAVGASTGPAATVVPWAIEAGLLQPAGDRYALTLRGRLLSNEVFARLV
ncbi:MAG TPA: coproporphyrinogen-III oxidase family protein [Candidatus Limnocylindrales bacterium]|nr:coproporphyrinogen-III oxidase family protein [Candidatus Limnocylindrales bacterium]